MPIVRKLIDMKTSKAVTLPKSWLQHAEAEAGRRIVAIALIVDRLITLQPIFEDIKIEKQTNCQQQEKAVKK